MPELPEVETIRRDLLERLKSALLKEVVVREPEYLSKRSIKKEDLINLRGAKLKDILRRGKQLAFILGESALIFHLGLTGSLIFKENTEFEILHSENIKHLILLLLFDNGTLLFRDLRKFGHLLLIPANSLKDHWENTLGPDALSVSKSSFEAILRRGKGQIKKFFLNQKNIAGLGNIYIDELLFRAKINPERKVESLSLDEIERLYVEMQDLLREAIFLRGSSIRDYVDGTGTPGLFQTKHLVYGKRGRPCPICGTLLEYKNLYGRGTTFCPTCQT